MHKRTIQILIHWLSSAGYAPDVQYLQKRYYSHPDNSGGGLVPITDTLRGLGIENTAVQISFDNLLVLKEPFLAYLKNEQQEQFVMATILTENKVQVYDGTKTAFKMPVDAFKNVFTGIIVAIDKKQAALKFSLRKNKKQILAGIAAISLIGLFALSSPAIPAILYFVLGMTGVLFSVLLIQKRTASHNRLIDKFCTAFANTDCDTVLYSSVAKISKHLSLTDIGIIYFAVQLFGIGFLPSSLSAFFMASVVASFFSLYSVYQQAVVIKKWCLLCLGVVIVLLLQGVIGVVFVNLVQISFSVAFSVLCLLFAGAAVWFLIKPLFSLQAKLNYTETALLTFKRNQQLFFSAYKNQEPVDDRLLKDAPEIIIGNAEAPVMITIITNPMCTACWRVHQELMDIQNQYGEAVCAKVVFYVPHQDEKEAKTRLASWLYYVYAQDRDKGLKLMDSWYKKQDMGEFEPFLKQDMSLQNEWLAIHRQWCIQNYATMTPILFVNGRLIPLIYEAEDLKYHISQIIEEEEQKVIT